MKSGYFGMIDLPGYKMRGLGKSANELGIREMAAAALSDYDVVSVRVFRYDVAPGTNRVSYRWVDTYRPTDPEGVRASRARYRRQNTLGGL